MYFRSTSRIDLAADLRDIAQALGDISISVQEQLAAAAQIQDDVEHIRHSFVASTQTIGQLRQYIATLNRSAAGLTNDVEAIVPPHELAVLSEGFVMVPTTIESGDYTAELIPRGLPSISTTAIGAVKAAEDSFLVGSKWVVASSGHEKLITIVLSIRLRLLNAGTSVGMFGTQAPVFLDEHGSSFDPLRDVPSIDNTRRNAREKIWAYIDDLLAKASTPLPKSNVGVPINFQPHTYTQIAGGLVLVSNSLLARKKRETVGALIPRPYTVGFRIKREHIVPEIRKQAGAYGASLLDVSFFRGYAVVGIHKRESDSCLHISVDVDVWFKYQMTIWNSSTTSLAASLSWLEYSWRINAERCWPVCDRVIGKAEDKLNETLPSFYNISSKFLDASGDVEMMKAQIEPFGLTLLVRQPYKT